MLTYFYILCAFLLLYKLSDFLNKKVVYYWYFIRNNKFYEITAMHRKWTDTGNIEFSPKEVFKEEYRSLLSESTPITFLAEVMDTNIPNKVFVSIVDKNGERVFGFLYHQGGFSSAHIPKDQIIEMKPIKSTFWRYCFKGLKVD